MRRVPLFLVAAVALVLATPALAHAQDQIGVVDMLGIIEDHPDTEKARQDLKKARDQAVADANKTREEVKRKQKELETLTPRTVKYSNLQRAIARDIALAEHRLSYAQTEALAVYASRLESVYQAVRGQVMAVARRRGLKLVLQTSDDPINANNRDDFVLKVALRGVVWADRSIDITDDVRTAMRLGRQSPPRVPPPVPAGVRPPGAGK